MFRNKVRMYPLNIPFNVVLEILANIIKPGRKKVYKLIRKT